MLRNYILCNCLNLRWKILDVTPTLCRQAKFVIIFYRIDEQKIWRLPPEIMPYTFPPAGFCSHHSTYPSIPILQHPNLILLLLTSIYDAALRFLPFGNLHGNCLCCSLAHRVYLTLDSFLKLVVICPTPQFEYNFHEIKDCVLTLSILLIIYYKHYTLWGYHSHPRVHHHYKQRLMLLFPVSEEVQGLC